MANDITLSAGMRSNLLSLQNINKLMDRTQERLSTGLKVNSAIDNPSSYYTAQSLNNRANDLEALLDSMGQAVQTIQAANEGIESITSFLEQAKSVVNQALEAKSADVTADVTSQVTQYNTIMTQITTLAGDASYKGINLLKAGGALTVTFNEGRTSSLTVTGFDASAAGLLGNDTTKVEIDITDRAETYVEGKSYSTGVYITNGTDYYQVNAPIDGSAETSDTWDEIIAATSMTTKITDGKKSIDASTSAAVTTAFSTVVGLNDVIDTLDNAVNVLRNKSSELGNAYSILETRQGFTREYRWVGEEMLG